MKNKSLLTALAVIALGVSAQAAPITITFLENGLGNQGSSSTFTESGVSLTAFASSGQALFAKNQGAGETGLGIASDPTGDHEIYGTTYIQLLTGGSPSGFIIDSLSFGSTTDGEIAQIYFSSALGSLGTFVGQVTSDTTFTIPDADKVGYLNVKSGFGNVLLASATGHVPDGSSTILLLGSALTGLGLLKRKFMA